MIALQDFHVDFIQTTLSVAESRGLLNSQSFFELVCEELVSLGELSNNYTDADIRNLVGRKPIEAYGYDFDEERNVLSILTHKFFQDDQIETLTISEIDKKFNRLYNFITKCSDGLYKELEETSPAYSMAYNIFQKVKDRNLSIKFYLLTDGQVTRNFKAIKDYSLGELRIDSRIIDIDYLYKNFLSQNEDSSFTVDIDLPYLDIPTSSDLYNSYLTYLNGDQLYEIYDLHGQRLLEQNVRTFLQFRGNVNKGIKNTISGAPNDFFAYNNGITATSSKVEVLNNRIIRIHDFQIVNGGQTTSSIYAAKKNEKLDISKLIIQMKLSVIKNGDKQSDFVSKVAEYANTQNKVNKSDFFSNSPFHKEMKNYSSRIWVNPKTGSQKMTRWYYERVRGEYLTEQMYLTKSKKNQFMLENPKDQLVEKTFLAKAENAWLQKPHIVSRGAQYCFGDFAMHITNSLEKNNLAITESYFKEAISRVILFRTVEKMISNSSWYNGGFRAQIVAYTIAYLSYYIKMKNSYFDFETIWTNQEVPNELFKQLKLISYEVFKKISDPPPGHANIGQWCKRQECWEQINKLNIEITLPKLYFKDKEEAMYQIKEDKLQKAMDSGIEKQTFVYELGQDKWAQIFQYCSKVENRRGITGFGFTALSKISSSSTYYPNEAQSMILYSIYEKVVIDEGLILA